MSETAQLTEAAAASEAVGAVLGQLMGDFAGAGGVILTELGLRLGLWDALATGSATAETVAERAGAAVPYVREWLRSQAAAGYVGYDPAADTFDRRALAEYRARLRDLDDDIADAESGHDPERAARARVERDALVAELTRSVGRGGRPRRLGDDTEKARKTVTARIHRALRLLDNPPPGAVGAPAPGRPHRHDLPVRARPPDRLGTMTPVARATRSLAGDQTGTAGSSGCRGRTGGFGAPG